MNTNWLGVDLGCCDETNSSGTVRQWVLAGLVSRVSLLANVYSGLSSQSRLVRLSYSCAVHLLYFSILF